MTKTEAIQLAKKAANKWFYGTFDDELLQRMEDMNLIVQAEGFSISALSELMYEIEYTFQEGCTE